jgi:predicted kinase
VSGQADSGRRLVLVSGPPGAGKSTLARPLAAELGFALLSKDLIKEALHDALGQDADLAWSRRLGAAAMELLWALAADSPAALLEANFWPNHPQTAEHLRGLAACTVEVHCSCPIEECRRRYAERAASRHVVHAEAPRLRLVAGAAGRGEARRRGAAEPATAGTGAPACTAPVPPDDPFAEAFAEAFGRAARPLGLAPVIVADTTRPVDIAAIAAQVRQLFRTSSGC